MSDKISHSTTYNEGDVYVIDDKQLNRLATMFTISPADVRRIISIVGPSPDKIAQYIQNSGSPAASNGVVHGDVDPLLTSTSSSTHQSKNYSNTSDMQRERAANISRRLAIAGNDPIARADVLLANGLNHMARNELGAALQRDPKNMAVLNKLAVISGLVETNEHPSKDLEALSLLLDDSRLDQEASTIPEDAETRSGVRADQGPTRTVLVCTEF